MTERAGRLVTGALILGAVVALFVFSMSIGSAAKTPAPAGDAMYFVSNQSDVGIETDGPGGQDVQAPHTKTRYALGAKWSVAPGYVCQWHFPHDDTQTTYGNEWGITFFLNGNSVVITSCQPQTS